MTTPAWGTVEAGGVTEMPPVGPDEALYAVVGFFGYDGTRWFDHVAARSPREAEDKARREQGRQLARDGSPGDFQVCAVLTVQDGRIVPVDTYATYLDPDVSAQD